VRFWGKEFWSINAFAMQMVFVLILGHMLASTPTMARLLRWLTSFASTEGQGLVLLCLFSTCACFINWGLGLIVSGIFAIELARKLGKVNFGLFIATAYSGFLVWHGGLSGSIPLKISAEDNVLQSVYPGLSLPLSQTVFSSWNLLIAFSLLVSMPLVSFFMRTDHKTVVHFESLPEFVPENDGSLRDRFENSSVLHWIFFIFFLFVMVDIVLQGESIDINRVNFIFLFLALILHQTPKRFLHSLQEAIGFSSGIVIQFPFYAGMMGLMQHSGLGDLISAVFVSVSTPNTLPLWTFISGAVVNFFVP
jgi:short-chain fatty acids transporter